MSSSKCERRVAPSAVLFLEIFGRKCVCEEKNFVLNMDFRIYLFISFCLVVKFIDTFHPAEMV